MANVAIAVFLSTERLARHPILISIQPYISTLLQLKPSLGTVRHLSARFSRRAAEAIGLGWRGRVTRPD